jgi:radical SAM protein with 4Fe4S-binding SPASM domain
MSDKTIYVKTTGTCNLNCKHCFTNGKTGDKTQFDPIKTADWIKSFIGQYPSDTHHHIEIHGGEPFLVPLSKLVLFADNFYDNEQISMCANSNLTFKLTDELVEFIKKYFDSNLGTSWDGWIRWETNRQFELWKANVQRLRAEGVYIHLKVSVSRELVATSPDWFLDTMESIGVDDIALERLTSGGNSDDNLAVFPNNEEQDNWYLALYLRYKERKPSFTIKTLDLLEMKIENGIVKIDTNCRNCEQNLVTINSNGTLGGCPNVATTHRHATLDDSVSTFLASDGRVDEIVKELNFSDNCLYCDVFDLCGGDCHRLSWQGNRCGGLKNTLRYLSGRDQQRNLIIKV